jgi:hypothetical protein
MPVTPTPVTPTTNIQKFKIPDMPDFEFLEAVKQKARKKKQGKEYAFVEGFESKILGLPAMKVKEQNLDKLIKQMQTGFEVRRAIQIIPSQKKDKKRLKKLLAQ